MKTKFVALLLSAYATSASAFDTFQNETATLDGLISCPNGSITVTPGFDDLWGCVFPGAEVVKVFVNADNKNVENVKFMWNDWTRDVGYGVHTDRDVAQDRLLIVATKYAPEAAEDLVAAFSGTSGTVFQNQDYTLTYTYLKGPSIDERLVTITTN